MGWFSELRSKELDELTRNIQRMADDRGMLINVQGAQNVYTTGVWSATNAAAAYQPEKDFPTVKSSTDLDNAVFKTPIESLVTLWIARYGKDWVKKGEVVEDEFFKWAVLRLRSAAKIEEHRIYENGTGEQVMRIIE